MKARTLMTAGIILVLFLIVLVGPDGMLTAQESPPSHPGAHVGLYPWRETGQQIKSRETNLIQPTFNAAPVYNAAFLTDTQLEDYNSMTTDQIRAFLTSNNSYFRQPIRDVDGQTFDPPVVISQAASQYRISPKIILATLQKESSGVTRSARPSDATMRSLMGCSWGTTARDQLRCAAERFRYYHCPTRNPGSVHPVHLSACPNNQASISVVVAGPC